MLDAIRKAPWLLIILVYIAAGPTQAAPGDVEAEDLLNLDLEELMQVEITSVSKKAEKLFTAPSAIFVITEQDIRRSGATSIPELLRMVPGLHVAQIDANKWAIASRGDNSLFANQLLVLIDGRSVYTPLFSGVFWEQPDYPLQDIKRIEVIRGPGASMWGSNAVAGVINIITKSADETEGTLISGLAGSEHPGEGTIRYGRKLGENTSARIYADYDNMDDSASPDGGDVFDDWHATRGGFRVDHRYSANDHLTFQGDIFNGQTDFAATSPSFTPPFTTTFSGERNFKGGNVLARWEHKFKSGSESSLQLFYDRVDRDEIIISHLTETYDLDFDHRFSLTDWNQIIWGVGFRQITNEGVGSGVMLDPVKRTLNQPSAFIQDESSLLDGRLQFQAGFKYEHSDYSGAEFQPSARVSYLVNDNLSLWASVARAVRTPSRVNADGSFIISVSPGPGGMPIAATFTGSNDFDSEKLLAYEAGLRYKPAETLSFDLSLFYNDYDSILTLERGAPFPAALPVPHLVLPLINANMAEAKTYGGELVIGFSPTEWWTLQGSYSYVRNDVTLDPGSTDTVAALQETRNPEHKATLRSLINLPHDFELDSMFRYVDSIPGYGIESYIDLDARLGWNYSDELEISLVGQNLLHDQHAEYIADFINVLPAEVERSFYVRVDYTF
ncbi:MAG: TonB-dependent receptor [Candidatus Dadabacteria bacterium]|nr:MAG: TonB-dependent receptor [Candidatus Dadabacteria bacterium]